MNFLNEGKKSKYTPNIILIAILGALFITIGQILGVTLYEIIKSRFHLNFMVNDFLFLALPFLFIPIIILIYMKIIEKRKFYTLGFYRKHSISYYIKGFLLGGVLFTAVILILFITGHLHLDKNPNIRTGLNAIIPILVIIPAWMIQSATEEIVTRGWIFQTANTRYNIYFAIIASSLLFGIMHIGNNGVSIIAIVNIILIGVLFLVYAISKGNLWGACGMHASWNFIQGNIFGLEVSGNNIFKYSLFKFNTEGNKLITGGSFGPEASIITTIVILVAILFYANQIKKYKSN